MLTDDFLLLEKSRDGLSRESFLEIARAFPFQSVEWQAILGLENPLEQVWSMNGLMAERLLLVAQVAQKGEHVFGNFEIFHQWLNSSVPALSNRRPITFLNNSFGLKILYDELGRIEHGIFA